MSDKGRPWPSGAYIVCQGSVCEHGLTSIKDDADGCTWQHGDNPEHRRTFTWAEMRNELWTGVDAWLEEIHNRERDHDR